uniref:Crossover junction endonuclease MUS81-like HHH domain-containing protein n=1 Tax=Peronospora matthiolae TaxID=2874970 RepID=A0AAV1SZV4_9STRA
MRADAAISELLMKCDEESVQLPENPWQALREVIAALRSTQDQALGYLQLPKALDQLKRNVDRREEAKGADSAAVATSSRKGRRQERTLVQDPSEDKQLQASTIDRNDGDPRSSGQSRQPNAMSPVASSKKKKREARKSRIQEEVEATPASRMENQALVDQLVQLGEFEMHHGHAQRGVSRMRAAKAIRDCKMVISSGAQARQLGSVGTALATKIDQLLNEGLEAALGEYEGDDKALPETK